MEIKYRHQLIYWVYWWMLATIIVGIIYGFWGIALTRRLNKIMQIALMSLVYLQLVMTRTRLQRDGVLLILFVLYELAASAWRGVFIFPEMFVDILTWPGLYLVFKAYTSENSLSDEFRQTTVVGMTIICLLCLGSIYKHRIGQGNFGGVIFYLYYALMFLPMVLYLLDRKVWKHVFFLVVIFLLMLSTKRAGTVIAAAGYMIYLFLEIRNSSVIEDKKRVYRIIFCSLFFAVLIFLILNQFFSFEIVERLMSITQDGGSGRSSIWIEIIEHFDKADTAKQWFGHGYQAVYYQLRPYGVPRMAHNSFLEFLYDYGYVGLCLFCMYFLTVLHKTFLAFKRNDTHNSIMVFAAFACLVLGMCSYLFEESRIMMPIAVFWGCIDGDRERMCTIHHQEINHEQR